MADNIRVLIVDDLQETRENVRKLLYFESDIEVIGQAGTGEEAIELAKEHQPDIILMDINMPGIDGIGASQKISELVPRAQVIIMSVQSDSDYIRRAMLAGARDFLTKPFGGDELVQAIRRVYAKRPKISATRASDRTGQTGNLIAPNGAVNLQEGYVLATFSPKGGSGCSTIAINLAVGLAQKGHKTILLDASLQFGDISVMLNMKPLTSILDLTESVDDLDEDLITSVVQVHKSSLHVLLAPPKPEQAELVKETHITKILERLRQIYDFVIIDTNSTIQGVELTILDQADKILLITQQSLPSLKNIRSFFDLMDGLDYASGKVWLVANRTSSKYGISVKDVSDILKHPVISTIPSDDITVNSAADQGVPVIIAARKNPVTDALNQLAEHIIGELISDESNEESKSSQEPSKSSLLGRLFSRS